MCHSGTMKLRLTAADFLLEEKGEFSPSGLILAAANAWMQLVRRQPNLFSYSIRLVAKADDIVDIVNLGSNLSLLGRNTRFHVVTNLVYLRRRPLSARPV
jgi:hypothetical protein